MVPARLVPATGATQWTGGLGWAGSLPKAKVTLSLNGQDTKMKKVVTKEGLQDVLLGHDYLGICELIIKAATAAIENGTDQEIRYPNRKWLLKWQHQCQLQSVADPEWFLGVPLKSPSAGRS